MSEPRSAMFANLPCERKAWVVVLRGLLGKESDTILWSGWDRDAARVCMENGIRSIPLLFSTKLAARRWIDKQEHYRKRMRTHRVVATFASLEKTRKTS